MRYQFEPRSGHTLDLARAKAIATDYGARHIRTAYPRMGDAYGKQWIGTNQPRTISFSVTTDNTAREIAMRYGDETTFVWNISELHYV